MLPSSEKAIRPGDLKTQLRAVKGMNDILPGEIARGHKVEHAFRRTFERAGFRFGVAMSLMLASSSAYAQLGGRGGAGNPAQRAPTQSSPTQNKTVGPRSGGDDDDAARIQVTQRAEPVAQAPADPLEIPPEAKKKIGTDSDLRLPPPTGELERQYFPYYQERRGDYRFRMIPPLYLEHTRGEGTAQEDTESLTGLLYYRRRSPKMDADIVFPLAWRVRDRENHVLVLGPLAHREAPNEHDNWAAPLVFEGSRKDGGYLHLPALLTTSHWGEKGAFTLAGPYFRDRTGSDVDWGVAPFVFHGDNGNADGARKTYTLIPPLLYFHRERELDESALTVIGPVISASTPKRRIFDVAPLLFTIRGTPETGGIRESHTTLFPFFHYGYTDKQSLFVLPGYLRRVTQTADTLITPFVTHATTRNGATSLTMFGPLAPVYYGYKDRDIGYHATGILPFYFGTGGPTGWSILTPLFGRWESYGVSRSYWFFPNITLSSDLHGWETDIHPLVYLGRNDDSSHTVLAPIFWDFASKKGRTTIGFPVFWRFADTEAGSLTQVAGNTLYMERKVAGGTDWQFHLLPLFSYGENPTGYWWNVLFGLAGYDRSGSYSRIKAFWLPISLGGGAAAASAPNSRLYE